jgi:hypothetical protein
MAAPIPTITASATVGSALKLFIIILPRQCFLAKERCKAPDLAALSFRQISRESRINFYAELMHGGRRQRFSG